MFRVFIFTLLSTTFLTLTISARADDARENDDEHERAEEVYKGTRKGEFLSLIEIIKLRADDIAGEIIEAKFERIGGAPAYEIYFLDKQGHRKELLVDARNGKILTDEGDD